MRPAPLATFLVSLTWVLVGTPACGGKSADAPAKPAASKATSKADKATTSDGQAKPHAGAAKATDKGEAAPAASPKAAAAPAAKTAPAGTVPVEPSPASAPRVKAKPYSALARIPKDVQLVVAGADIAAMWKDHIRKGLSGLPGFEANFTKANAAATAMAGIDLNDLNTLAKVGLDPAGELGLVMWPLEKATFCVYTTLTDGARYKKLAEEVMGKSGMKVVFEPLGDTFVAKIQEMALVIAPKAMYAVFAERPPKGDRADVLAVAKTVAGTKVADSILSHPDFVARTAKSKSDGNFRGWVDVGRLVTSAVAMSRARAASLGPNSYLADRLKTAKTGGDPQAIKGAEEAFARDKVWAERRRAELLAELKMVEAIYGSMKAAAWNYTVDDTGVHGVFNSALTGGSTLTKLLKPFKGMAATSKANVKSPMFLIHTATDKKALMELMELLAATEGDTLEKSKAEMKRELGLDVDEVLAALGSEGGLVVNFDTSKVLDTPHAERPKLFGGGFVFKLADETKIKAVLSKLFGMKEAQAFVKGDSASGVWTIDVPMFKPVYANVSGGWLSVSTDKGFHARLSGDGADSFVGKAKNKELNTILGAKDVAMLFSMDQAMVFFAFLGMDGRRYEPPMPRNPTEAQKKQIAEYQALKAKYDTVREAHERKREKVMLAAFQSLGSSAFTLEVAGPELTIRGGQYINAPLAELITTFVSASLLRQRQVGDSDLEALEQKVWKARGALRQPAATLKPAAAPQDNATVKPSRKQGDKQGK